MKSGKRNTKKSLVKKKSLFDHIKQITAVQSPNYWEEISDEDKKSWSNFMTHRFLSMKMEWVELVNELQKYNLKPKELYKLYTNILPKGNQWLKYTKGKNNMNYPKWLIDVVAKHMDVNKREAYDAIEMYMLTEGGMLELGEICTKWGVAPKEIEALGLNVLGSTGMYQAGNE